MPSDTTSCRSTAENTVEHPGSYYAASAHEHPEREALNDCIDADVCVIGGGFSGLSAALHLSSRARQVTLLEGARIGWGASGRNGGQLIHGLNASLDTFKRRYGQDTANFVGGLLQEGAGIIRQFIADYNIQCDLKQGSIFAAFNARQMRELEAKQILWRTYGMDEHEMLDKNGIREHVGTDQYLGGMLDHSGGHIHPLNLALGEAAALETLGGKIYEQSRVTRIDSIESRPVINTAHGQVRCNTLVICGNAYLGKTVEALETRVMPVSTQIMATEPLSAELANMLLPTDNSVEDIRYILDYYRLSADKRLLWGGGTVYGGTEPGDIIAKLRPNMEKIFPQLRGVTISYAWSGNFALTFTRVPLLGKLGPNTFYAMGYSGHGVTGSHLFGKLLSEAIDGETDRFDRFAALPWYPFPGGQRYRAAYSTVGSWWYRTRDALGI